MLALNIASGNEKREVLFTYNGKGCDSPSTEKGRVV